MILRRAVGISRGMMGLEHCMEISAPLLGTSLKIRVTALSVWTLKKESFQAYVFLFGKGGTKSRQTKQMEVKVLAGVNGTEEQGMQLSDRVLH